MQPVLQRQDGSFIGTVSTSAGSAMIGFTPSGTSLFDVPNDTPQIATSDNEMIGASSATTIPTAKVVPLADSKTSLLIRRQISPLIRRQISPLVATALLGKLRSQLTAEQGNTVDALKKACPGYAVMRSLVLSFRTT